MAHHYDKYGRPVTASARHRRPPPPPRPRGAQAQAPGRPPNPRHARASARPEAPPRPPRAPRPGPAGVAPQGGGGTVVVEVEQPQKDKKWGWKKVVITGALAAAGGILAYRTYNKLTDRDAGAERSAALSNAVPNPGMPMGHPMMHAQALLTQSASPQVNQALALQALVQMQAQQQLQAQQAAAEAAARQAAVINPAPVAALPEDDEEEMSEMDRFVQQFDEELGF